jgi:hypothetical protein
MDEDFIFLELDSYCTSSIIYRINYQEAYAGLQMF